MNTHNLVRSRSSRFATAFTFFCLAGLTGCAFAGAGGERPEKAAHRYFTNHGIAAPVERSSGVFPAMGANGEPIILAWTRATMQVIDAATGEVEAVTAPMSNPSGDVPFYSVMTADGRLYSHFGSHFMEFDSASRSFTFIGEVSDIRAMAMFESEDGIIYSASNPNAHLIAFDPAAGVLTEYGPINQEEWQQHPSSVATDAAGWVYIGIGRVQSRVVAFDPRSGNIEVLFSEQERQPGSASVYLGEDGYVYAQPYPDAVWYRLKDGAVHSIVDDQNPKANRVPRSGGRSYHVGRVFPNGARLKSFSMPDGIAVIEDPAGDTHTLSFSYETDGAMIYSIILGPDGHLYASTGHPLRWVRLNPATGEMVNWGQGRAVGHMNALAVAGDKIYGAYYSGGILFEYDPQRTKGSLDHESVENPAEQAGLKPLTREPDHVFRPHVLVAHPSGALVMTGTQSRALAYGGGGMLIHDLESGEDIVLTYEDLIPVHRTGALVVLENGDLLGGTLTRPRPGYPPNDEQAALYILDWDSKELVFQTPLPEPHGDVQDLLLGPDGMVYGITRSSRGPGQSFGQSWFIFDPQKREFIHSDMGVAGAGVGSQGPQLLATGPDGRIYVLLHEAIHRIDPATRQLQLVVELPVPATNGIAFVGEHLFYISGSRIWSFDLAKAGVLSDANAMD